MVVLRKFLTVISICAVSAGRMVVHESRAAAPVGFVSQGVAPAEQMLTLRVALAPNNIAGLEEKLMSLSTPGNPEFRQWLSMEEVRLLFLLSYFCISNIS
jgi:tripeptidyl-peptidase-1